MNQTVSHYIYLIAKILSVSEENTISPYAFWHLKIFKNLDFSRALPIIAIVWRLEFSMCNVMHTGSCVITLHIAAATSHASLGRAHGGKSPRKIGGERADGRAGDRASGENEKRLSSTWIGSGAEKELPARKRRAQTRLSASPPRPLRSHLSRIVSLW